MLSRRSRVLVTVATVIGLFSLADCIGDMASWQKEPSLWYWYDQWIVVGVSMVIAGISVVFDVRRNR